MDQKTSTITADEWLRMPDAGSQCYELVAGRLVVRSTAETSYRAFDTRSRLFSLAVPVEENAEI